MSHPIHDPRYQRLAALLVELRKAKGLLQQDVADRLGRTQGHVSRVESGARRVDFIELLEYLEALEVDLHEFVDRIIDKPLSSLPR